MQYAALILILMYCIILIYYNILNYCLKSKAQPLSSIKYPSNTSPSSSSPSSTSALAQSFFEIINIFIAILQYIAIAIYCWQACNILSIHCSLEIQYIAILEYSLQTYCNILQYIGRHNIRFPNPGAYLKNPLSVVIFIEIYGW